MPQLRTYTDLSATTASALASLSPDNIEDLRRTWIAQALAEGASKRQIAISIGMSRSAIYRYLAKPTSMSTST